MDNPPGSQNCHFLDLLEDDVGPCGVSIQNDKSFNERTNWSYLNGILHEKVDDEITTCIAFAHNRLPELFSKIHTDTRIVYPFKFDCITGEFIDPKFEKNFRKSISQGNGEARATGFAVPVFGRLPKIFADAYLLKC